MGMLKLNQTGLGAQRHIAFASIGSAPIGPERGADSDKSPVALRRSRKHSSIVTFDS